MNKDNNSKERPDPERTKALGNLPTAIIETLTKDEIRAFLFNDEWPDSLAVKLKDYLVDDGQKS